LQEVARKQQPGWDAKAIAEIGRFVDTATLDTDLDAKAVDAQIKNIATAYPFVVQPHRGDGGSPASRRPLGPAQPKPSGKPFTL
jgi:hypothetical protein